MLASLALLALPSFQGAVEDEWRVRRWALEEAAQEELGRALEAQDWRVRLAALDACERALESGRRLPAAWDEVVHGALRHEHANVRARALGVLRARGGGQLAAELAEALAGDDLPTVRLELAAALEVVECEAALELLMLQTNDPDQRVAATALRSLCALSSPATPALGWVFLKLDGERLLQAATWLSLAEPGPALPDLMIRIHDGDDPAARAWRAVFGALAFAPGHEADAQWLIDGWVAPGERDPRRRRLLLTAARSGDEALAVAWLRAVDAGRASDEWCDDEWIDGALTCVGPRRAVELAAELALGPEALTRLLPVAGRTLTSWQGPDLDPWLSSEDVRVRRALVEGLALTFSRTGDATAGEGLARALQDSDPAASNLAFRTLADAEPIAPWVDALFAAWRELPSSERETRLTWLPRGVPLPAFRTTLLERGERGHDCELLAGFVGDAEVRARIEGWLTEDLERLAAVPSTDEVALRQLVLTIQGELRALANVDAEASVAVLVAALEASLGTSTEVGKVAVKALARSNAGLAELARYLHASRFPDVDRRTRIEAAIALAATEALIRDFEHAAWDLRGRMLQALARASAAEAFDFLESLVLDEAAGIDDRLTAMPLLGRDPERATAVLMAVVRSARVGDLRLAAIGNLGRVGGEPARDFLLAELERNGLALGRTAEERALLHGALLEALGAAGEFPDEHLGEWLAAPLGRAAADLDARFRGEDRPAVGFAWRGELALARSLAGEGRVATALGRTPRWWRLDGRLLLGLGAAAAAEPEAARSLCEAGLVGLGAELEAPPEDAARARCRLLGFAWAEGRWEAAARLAERLLVLRRAGEIPRQVWSEFFGTFDREQGIDPDARVRSAVWQARAWSALLAGDSEKAGALAEEAAARLGFSELARAEQRRLSDALQESSKGR